MEIPLEFLSSLFLGFNLKALLLLCGVLVLLFCSALISGSEVAYFSLEQKDLDALAESHPKVHNSIKSLLDDPKKLLATILISNNFVNIGVIIMSSILTTELFDFSGYPIMGFIVQVIAITFLLLLFGEVLPKVYATSHPIRLSHFMSTPLFTIGRILKPVSGVLVRSTVFFTQGSNPKGKTISVDELSHALEITTDESADQEEQKILKGIVKFGNTDVKQIMTGRVDVVAAEYEQGFDEIHRLITSSGYSRIPVYKSSFDEVEGVLYIKDLLPHIEDGDHFQWQKLIRPPFFVPENKKIDDLLEEFQEKKIHQAIVVDEYGGTSGLVTMEDILEEIVGDISDEFDTDDLVYSKLDESNFIFNGKIPLNDLYRILDIDGAAFEDRKGESDTLAGFIIEIAERIPHKSETVEFQNFTFKIEAADSRKISTIKVTVNPIEEGDEEPAE